MIEIKIIIFIISLLFIVENKARNNIIYFIIIIINISILMFMEINYSYISFILIIVYSTAIIILFTFVIMLPQRLLFNSTIDILLLSLLLFIPFIYTTNISINITNDNSSIYPPLIGDYLYNTDIGHYYIVLVLLLLFIPVPGIFYILKTYKL